jgi:hypothetical protein
LKSTGFNPVAGIAPNEGTKTLRPGPAAEQIDPAAAELPGARPGQEKARSPAFDQTMDFVEQTRKTLDFVDDDDGVLRGELLGQPARIPAQGEEYGCVEEVTESFVIVDAISVIHHEK